MKERFESWLEQRSGLPGVLGCGVRFPDCTSCGSIQLQDVSPGKVDQAWDHIAAVLADLTRHRLSATRSLWTYADGQLHCALRPDGILLAVITPASTHAYQPALVEKLIEEFLRLA